MTTYLRPIQRAALGLAFLCVPMIFSGMPVVAQSSTAQADNSAQNKNAGSSADSQSNSQADRLTTANVRKAIMADKGLSVYAHNVKILTHNGVVTLKGPVKSDDEKQQVDNDAVGVVSQDKVINQLTVKQ